MENHDGKSLYANIHAGFRSFNGVMDKVFFFPDPSVNFAMENLDENGRIPAWRAFQLFHSGFVPFISLLDLVVSF